jgi:hypothetical protein
MRNIWFNHLQRDADLYHESYVSLDAHNLDENVNCFQTLNDATEATRAIDLTGRTYLIPIPKMLRERFT